MKFIVFILLTYLAYRTFIRPMLITGGEEENKPNDILDDEGYLDYEEVNE